MKWILPLLLLVSCKATGEPDYEVIGRELDLAAQDLADIARLLDEEDELVPYILAFSDIVAAVNVAVENEGSVLEAVNAGFTALERVLLESAGLDEDDRLRVEAGAIVVRSVLRRVEAYS